MRVDVDGKVGVLLANRANEPFADPQSENHSPNSQNHREHSHSSSLGLQQTSHVLDAEHVDALSDELIDEVEVVVEGVLGLLGVRDITAVADDGLADTTGLLRGIDTELQLHRR